jgi:hypothetical protein
LLRHGTGTVRVTELKKGVEKVPPVNDYVFDIGLERDEEVYRFQGSSCA